MDSSRSFSRFAAVAAVVSLPFAAANLATSVAAVGFDFNAFDEPLILLRMGAERADLWRAAMVFDLLGYYLLIVPLVLVLWRQLGTRHPDWSRFVAFCLLAYCLIGAMGAAILAAVVPPLMTAYSTAPEAQRAVLEAVFSSHANAVYIGLWNLLEQLLAGIGWVGLAVLLRGRKAIALATLVLGAACLLDSLGLILGWTTISEIGLFVYLPLAPTWACWLGIDLLRRPHAVGQG